MSYDLEAIEAECAAQQLACLRISEHEVEITLEPNCVLYFANLVEEEDTMIGFKDTPWHSHDDLTVMTSADTSAELGPVEVVRLLSSGQMLVVSQWIDGKLHDRWLTHRDDRLDLKYLEPNEELRVKPMA
ncbi:MAG: hypothetical protein HRU46_10130 [Verrucomicrobiales bacterium]|nr:hypothetical protein [Verrucomicrobiales bacterium]